MGPGIHTKNNERNPSLPQAPKNSLGRNKLEYWDPKSPNLGKTEGIKANSLG